MPTDPEMPTGPPGGLAADVAELEGAALRGRWGLALVAIGWTHLAIFLFCQSLYSRGDRRESHFLPLWGLDLASTVAIYRTAIMARGRRPKLPLLSLVTRVWVTFLILCFSLASLNRMVGFETDWFKATWATLATFGFATMAWIFHLRFLIPAVQMSLTAWLIARHPQGAYWILGVSWCLALTGVGLALERRRAVLGVDRGSRSPRPIAIAPSVEAG